jgi:hypothetical protein
VEEKEEEYVHGQRRKREIAEPTSKTRRRGLRGSDTFDVLRRCIYRLAISFRKRAGGVWKGGDARATYKVAENVVLRLPMIIINTLLVTACQPLSLLLLAVWLTSRSCRGLMMRSGAMIMTEM